MTLDEIAAEAIKERDELRERVAELEKEAEHWCDRFIERGDRIDQLEVELKFLKGETVSGNKLQSYASRFGIIRKLWVHCAGPPANPPLPGAKWCTEERVWEESDSALRKRLWKLQEEMWKK